TEGVFKARLLLWSATFSAVWVLFSHHEFLDRILGGLRNLFQVSIPAWISWVRLPETFDAWIYDLMERPLSLGGVDLRQLTLTCGNDIAMFGLGGLVRTGTSLLLGAILNYCLLAPWMIHTGDIPCAVVDGVEQPGVYGFAEILKWSLWGGVALMTTASLWSFLADPKTLFAAMSLKKRKNNGEPEDCLKHIELPYPVFWIGIPIVSALVVWETWWFFDVPILLGVVAIPLIFVFTIIAVHATALTAITPVGPLGKLTQLTFAVLHPGSMTTNLASAGITASVASNASNLLMDIKPGYMLGARPRQQAIGHVLGIIAGTCVSVPVWAILFLQNGVDQVITREYPMPSAVAWKAVAEMLANGLDAIPVSARWAALIGGILGIVLEILRKRTKGKFPISPVGLGLACLLNFSTCFVMFLGSFFFWMIRRTQERRPRERGFFHVFSENPETISGGVIAGAALAAVVIQMLLVFVFS
ncbi:MAG: OPT/YSL family transporter, partial [Planctomycetia bacterium]|nr:OPT/YSL family transporter [Planctomycetia bacterium]